MDKWWNMELNRWEKPIWGKYDYSSFEVKQKEKERDILIDPKGNGNGFKNN